MTPRSPQRASHVFTVSELTAVIGRALRDAIPRATVEGEISNWRVSPAGHAYFKLRDEHASLSCVIFRSALGRVRFNPADGQSIQANGAVNVYAPQGQYQLVVESMREAGLGDLHLAFLKLKEKLERQGLFAAEHKRSLPKLPRRVGVVTSPTGAAIRDILNVLRRRFAGVDVVLAPVRVQGREAPAEIVEAIRRLERLGGIDVIIVGRGGGSLEDLAAFNDEAVARAIFASKIPIISAVGHEIDFSIADFVADLRAPTPSAAAELVVQERQALVDRVRDLTRRLGREVAGRVTQARLRLDALAESHVMAQPLARIRDLSQRVDHLSGALMRGGHHALRAHRAKWRPLDDTLRALDPTSVLARGYSVVTDAEGRVLREADQVSVGDEVEIRLQRGSLDAEVKRRR